VLRSRLDLTRPGADLYVNTLLERSKGSALDIIVSRHHFTMDRVRAETLALLSPHAQRIGSLDFVNNYWADVQELSEVASGPLPLLRTLKINVVYEHHWNGPTVMTPPSLPLFAGAINLKELHLRSDGLLFLDHFIFPNLTILKLSTMAEEGVSGSQLLNFLEASPTLRTVHIRIEVDILLDVPPGRVVVLPNVETFNLSMGEDAPGCKVAAHISCPSARLASLLYEQDATEPMSPEIFPTSITWNAIACQYSASAVDEVVLEITTAQDPIIATAQDPIITCSLTFLSPDPAVLTLGFKVTARYNYEADNEFEVTLGERHVETFSQASRTIRTHPLLADIKRLRIQDRHVIDSDQLAQIASEVGRLFKSMGSLDALTLDVFDLRPYLAPFLDLPELLNRGESTRLVHIAELTIAQPSPAPAEQECMAALVELAKLKHGLGVPFERVTIRTKNHPPKTAEWLGPWVGVVDCLGEV
jgi:hypothetical protein